MYPHKLEDKKLFSYILSEDDKPTQSLIGLLNILNIQHHNDLASIVDATQKAWLRKPNEERWHQQEVHQEKKEELQKYFAQLRIVDEIQPSKKHYAHAVFLGATVARVRTRLNHLKQLLEQGISFDHIVVLGGQRPLDPKLENEAILFDANNSDLPFKSTWKLQGNIPANEMEMMKMVIDQADLPESIKTKIMYVDTPMQTAADGTLRRPTTGDTIKEWLKMNPEKGSILAISNQPYVGYQDSVIRTFVPGEFTIETVGQAADTVSQTTEPDLTIANALDNIARWLYQEKIRRCTK